MPLHKVGGVPTPHGRFAATAHPLTAMHAFDSLKATKGPRPSFGDSWAGPCLMLLADPTRCYVKSDYRFSHPASGSIWCLGADML